MMIFTIYVYKDNKKYTLCKSCTFKSITSIFTNLVSLESLLNLLFRLCTNLNLFKSRQDVPFVVLGYGQR